MFLGQKKPYGFPRMANGGIVGRGESSQRGARGGLLASTGSGRKDILPRDVAPGSYVVPADIVSALGDGNTLAGSKALDSMLDMNSQKAVARSNGIGGAKGGSVPIITAGGEYVIPPEAIVAKFGDLDSGHNILDQFVLQVREKNIKRLKKLAPPRK